MVGFLPPLVQEAPISGMLTIWLYVASSAGAGALVGLLLGAAGGSLPGVAGSGAARGLLAAVALGCALVELRGGRMRLIEWRRQVPPSWRYDYGPGRAAIMYG